MTRLAVIEKEKCNPVGCGNYLCIRACPVNRTGKECIVIGDNKKAKIITELCTGCGICTKRCPYGAIHIINLPEELTEQPVHQYGENGFHLYNLPTPVFGKIIGIVGRNGVGKSTAMKILASVLKPNLGKTDAEKVDYNTLLNYFKGTEAQIFFEKIKKGKIKLSYKLQHVDLIPTQVKGTARKLLEKVDEKGKLEEYAKQLQISEILDSKMSEISGGELQRVAILAASLKKADVYFFDEPTSYLDIKQRINVSKFIRNLADENTAVMVVEHDLIILDYMTDLVHIIYGEENAYGIVSQPRATKAALNVYLSGYLKEENMMFRDHAIKFSSKPPEKESKNKTILTSWKNIEKKLGNFTLKAEKGEITRPSVIGVLGENATGKTTFVKILAEVIKPDKGEFDKKVKVSYKPQYLEPNDDMVMAVLHEAVKKYSAQIIRPLNLEPLLMKKLDELSGGQLQRVAIALCLSRDADLYLLDEPSAYLDVEQRLELSKMIKEIMEQKGKSALIVDHDLLFMDYISQKLMVFEGKPAKLGNAKGPFDMEEGMNIFLKELDMTYRRDEESSRPRINKPGSQKDREQKSKGKLYYA